MLQFWVTICRPCICFGVRFACWADAASGHAARRITNNAAWCFIRTPPQNVFCGECNPWAPQGEGALAAWRAALGASNRPPGRGDFPRPPKLGFESNWPLFQDRTGAKSARLRPRDLALAEPRLRGKFVVSARRDRSCPSHCGEDR